MNITDLSHIMIFLKHPQWNSLKLQLYFYPSAIFFPFIDSHAITYISSSYFRFPLSQFVQRVPLEFYGPVTRASMKRGTRGGPCSYRCNSNSSSLVEYRKGEIDGGSINHRVKENERVRENMSGRE